jgi:hypothetical protein
MRACINYGRDGLYGGKGSGAVVSASTGDPRASLYILLWISKGDTQNGIFGCLSLSLQWLLERLDVRLSFWLSVDGCWRSCHYH